MEKDPLSHARLLSGKTLLIVPILLLMLISSVGVLDKVSEGYVNSALTKALIAFGTARAINAAMSVAQSTTVSVEVGVGAQVSPGEVLDPLDDLVEDYSSAMKLAIGSLVIQKILLEVVSDEVFKVLLVVSGMALLAALMMKGTGMLNLCFKVFVSLIFLRFILVAVVVLNGLVNHAFIDERRDQAMEQLSVLPDDLEAQIESGSTALNESSDEEMVSAEDESGIASSVIARMRSAVASAGEAVSGAARAVAATVDLPALRQKVENAVEDMVTAMALFILQTLILPLLFLFALSRASRSIWGLDLQEFVTRKWTARR